MRDFDAPNLKRAVTRCWGCESAPAHLRRRVENLCVRQRRHHWAIWPTAAAALLALVVGLRMGRSPDQPKSAAILSASLQGQLADVHDRCTRQIGGNRLPMAIPVNPAIAQSLRSQLSRPVLVAKPTESGWKFRGANVCPVGDTRSAHVVFVNGESSLSVFSLPGSVAPAVKEGAEFDAVSGGHRLAGFVRDGAVFCLVGTGPGDAMSADRLNRIRQAMEPMVTSKAYTPTPDAVAVALGQP